MPTIAVDKAALFKALGQEWVILSKPGNDFVGTNTLSTGTPQRNSTSYVSSSVSLNVYYCLSIVHVLTQLGIELDEDVIYTRTLVSSTHPVVIDIHR